MKLNSLKARLDKTALPSYVKIGGGGNRTHPSRVRERINMNNQQYNAVVAQNKSLQGELRLANRIIDSMVRQLAVDDDCNNWNEVIICQSETIPCEECIKKHYELEALQELEAENGLH